MGLHLNEGGDDLAENHEINVTPFIDVMLVLLIIFMVAAPGHSRYQGRPAGLDRQTGAEAREAGVRQRQGRPEAVRRRRSGPGTRPAWPMLDAKTKGDKETTIFFQADKGVDYGDLMEVMNNMRSAGYLKVGLVGLETAAKK